MASPYIITFKKIKSLFFNACTNVNAVAITASICQISTIPFTFTPLKWKTEFTNPLECFGSISTYEYLIPLGWQMNGTTSTGNWIAGTNTVTFTSNANTGGVIQIRATNNSCGTNLTKGQISFVSINRPAPSFTVSPSTVPIVCNTPKTQTFTINQSGTSACTYSYVWELGANNGWLLPSGADAPATINTTTNTITLTSCGLFQKNVNAKAITGSSQFAASPSIISSSCNFNITGNTNFCKSSTFFINGLPGNAIVAWSLSNTTTATLSNLTGSSTTVTKTGIPPNVNLIASITVPGCNGVYLITKPLVVGSTESPVNLQPTYGLDCNSTSFIVNQPTNGSITYTTTNGLLINGNASPYTVFGNTVSISSPTAGVTGVVSAVSTDDCARLINDYYFEHGCIDWDGMYNLNVTYGAPQRGEPLQAQIEPMPEWPGGAMYYWYINGAYFTSTSSPNISTFDWPCNNGNPTSIAVVAVVPVGGGYNSTPALVSEYQAACTGARLANNNTNPFIYPNPASTIVIIKLDDILNESGLKTDSRTKKKVGLPVQIKIMDRLGNIRRVYRFINNEKIVTINVADIPSGLYYIEINNSITYKKIQLKIAR